MTSPEQNYFAHFAMRYPGNSVYRSGLVDTLVTHANMRRTPLFRDCRGFMPPYKTKYLKKITYFENTELSLKYCGRDATFGNGVVF